MYKVRILENTLVAGFPVTKGDIVEVTPDEFSVLRDAGRCTVAEATRDPVDPPPQQKHSFPHSIKKGQKR
jgi:hypothetical protein